MFHAAEFCEHEELAERHANVLLDHNEQPCDKLEGKPLGMIYHFSQMTCIQGQS